MTVIPRSRRLRFLLLMSVVSVVAATASFSWLSQHLTYLVEQTLHRTYGPDVSLGKIEVGWNRVILSDLRLRHPGDGPAADRIRIRRIEMTPHFRALLSRRIEINSLRMENPSVLVEIAPDGSVVSPLASRPAASRSAATAGAVPPLLLRIDHAEIAGGELVLLDRTASRLKAPGVSNRSAGYHLIRFTGISFRTGPVTYPPSSASLPVNLSLTAPGPGSLAITGGYSPATLDTDLTITLRHWDITSFRPYYLKPGDQNVVHGVLDADATVRIAGKTLRAPGEIRLSGLELDPSGQGIFMGMSSRAVLGVLKNDRGAIDTTFLVSGDLANPQFKVQQSLMTQIETGLARKLGVPIVSDVGKGIYTLGEKGLKGIMNLFGGGK